MEVIFTSIRKPFLQLLFHTKAMLFLLLMVFGVGMESHGQTKEYATVTPSSGRNSATAVLGVFGSYAPTNNNNVALVSNPLNAGDAGESTFASLRASNLNVLLAQVSGEAWVQMKFPRNRGANTTTCKAG